jgi:uncharacterized protein (DUF2267 family)
MKYNDFLAELGRRGLGRREAERAAEVVIGEVIGGLTWQGANLVGGDLPGKLRAKVQQRVFQSSMTRFSLDVLTRRVAEVEEVDAATARAHLGAVLGALDATLSEHGRERLRSELALVHRELAPTD